MEVIFNCLYLYCCVICFKCLYLSFSVMLNVVFIFASLYLYAAEMQFPCGD